MKRTFGAIGSGFFLGCFILASCAGTSFAQSTSSKMRKASKVTHVSSTKNDVQAERSPNRDLAPNLEPIEEPAAPPVTPVPPPIAPRVASAPASTKSKPTSDEEKERREDVKQTIASRVRAQREQLPICRQSGGPTGKGRAELVFEPSGRVDVSLDSRFGNTSTGDCVARRFIRAGGMFEGEPITVVVDFEL